MESTNGLWKTIYNYHQVSFRNKRNANSTRLFEYIWKYKEKYDEESEVKWSVLKRTTARKKNSKYCEL